MKQFLFAAIVSFLSMGEFAGPLKIDLQTPKEEFILHEALNLKYTLKNTSDKYLIIPVIENTFIFESDDGTQTRQPKELSVFTIDSPCDRKLILEPHQSFEKILCDHPFHGFTEIGNFKVIFEMDGTRYKCDYFDNYTEENTIIWRGNIRTSPINIKVLPPQGADLEVLNKYKIQGINEALSGRDPRNELLTKYPQSVYTLWIYMQQYRTYRDCNKCLIQSSEMNAVANYINSETRPITSEKQRQFRKKSLEENNREIQIMEKLASHHQSSDEIIGLLYRLAEHYLRIYEYSKAEDTFHKIIPMTSKAECDDKYKESSKRFVAALQQQGK